MNSNSDQSLKLNTLPIPINHADRPSINAEEKRDAISTISEIEAVIIFNTDVRQVKMKIR